MSIPAPLLKCGSIKEALKKILEFPVDGGGKICRIDSFYIQKYSLQIYICCEIKLDSTAKIKPNLQPTVTCPPPP